MIIIKILIDILIFYIEITLISQDKKETYRINAQGDRS